MDNFLKETDDNEFLYMLHYRIKTTHGAKVAMKGWELNRLIQLRSLSEQPFKANASHKTEKSVLTSQLNALNIDEYTNELAQLPHNKKDHHLGLFDELFGIQTLLERIAYFLAYKFAILIVGLLMLLIKVLFD